ncbi:hypothetical protein FKC55_00735 [Listeria monocytogenes]|uniref:hypothetical protein n=1 Tax=Listeria booriae TaxID=1552123 RepID=UPI0012C84107|nr:hypothetical protein [Listeria booriae]ECL0264396.1 hypothetical protein [Listeria monocytogenes]EKR8711462.1 hypothetical protein [Listeria monocytogenes]ELQ0050880.1 hypothetical protein [Listeria monocytogenes]ELQ0053991.1 hypothetical protein [Listeria monocytogenes]MBC2315212.1 hypothetical protein [Listeria booriae]
MSETEKLYSKETIGKHTYQIISVFPTHGAETFHQKMKRILSNHLSELPRDTCAGTNGKNSV